jgi:hypothetical protein
MTDNPDPHATTAFPRPPEPPPAVEQTVPIIGLPTVDSPYSMVAPVGGPPSGVDPTPGRGQRSHPDRRWLWLVGLVVFALLAVSGIVVLISATIPHGSPRPAVTLGAPPATATSPVVTTASAEPPITALPSLPTTAAQTRTPTIPPPITATPPLPTTTPTRPHDQQTVPVPNVVGLPVQVATNRLRAAGFTVNVVSAPIGRPRQGNRVFLQSPRGGQNARPGSTVTIVISAPLQPR